MAATSWNAPAPTGCMRTPPTFCAISTRSGAGGDREPNLMSRILIKNGYVVPVDAARNVFPGGYVSVDGARITTVGPTAAAPAADGFDEVLDATGCIVLPGLINMHQHHWYTLFKGLADGYLLEDWVSDLLLPLSLAMGEEARRGASSVAAMEMLATGTTCALNHSLTTTTHHVLR